MDAVIFDWSGVVSDDRRPVYEANMRILEAHKKPLMEFDTFFSQTMGNPVEFHQSAGIDITPEKLFASYKKHFNDVVNSGVVPSIYPRVREVLSFLENRNVRMGVLSSHPERNLRREAESYNVGGFFEIIMRSSRDKVAGIMVISSQLGLSRDSTIYVGDTIYDIRSAKTAGVVSAGVCNGYHSQERLESEGPDFLFKNLADLTKLPHFNGR